MVVGTGLAVAGATFQGLLRNPLADPYVLGTASGAALGAAIAVLIPARGLVLEFGLLNVLAFVGALLVGDRRLPAVADERARAADARCCSPATRSARCWPRASRWRCTSRGPGLRQIFAYLLGGFDGTSWVRLAVAAPLIIGGSLLILLRARSLNGFLLGEEAAAHLGVDVRRERAILLGLASLVTAAGVAVAGLIGFVGLVVPHVVRLLVGPNARLVLPISALFGASLLAAADLVARHARRDPGRRDHRGHRGAVLPRCCCAGRGPGTSCERGSCCAPTASRSRPGRARSCATSRSSWGRASGSRSSARTARASPRCSASSPGTLRPDGRPRRARRVADRRARAARRSPGGSRSCRSRRRCRSRCGSRRSSRSGGCRTRRPLRGARPGRPGGGRRRDRAGGPRPPAWVATPASCRSASASSCSSPWRSRRTRRSLLLDEPTVHLDLRHQVEAMELLRDLNERDGTAMVAVLHDLGLAAHFFPRLVVIDRGRLVADGPPAEVLTDDLIRDVFGVEPALVRLAATPRLGLRSPVPCGPCASARLALDPSPWRPVARGLRGPRPRAATPTGAAPSPGQSGAASASAGSPSGPASEAAGERIADRRAHQGAARDRVADRRPTAAAERVARIRTPRRPAPAPTTTARSSPTSPPRPSTGRSSAPCCRSAGSCPRARTAWPRAAGC